MSLDSLWCSLDFWRGSVAARFDRADSSLVVGRDLSPLCNFACIVVALISTRI